MPDHDRIASWVLDDGLAEVEGAGAFETQKHKTPSSIPSTELRYPSIIASLILAMAQLAKSQQTWDPKLLVEDPKNKMPSQS